MAFFELNYVFGIHFGLHNCSIAYDDRIGGVIFFSQGNSAVTFPSIVYVPEQPRLKYLVCDTAESKSTNVIQETRRLLGTKIDDPQIQELIRTKHFPFCDIVADEDNNIMLQYNEAGAIVRKYPWELCAMILRHLHDLVCRRFNCNSGMKVGAVVTVPVYFTHFQRAEMARAGEAAGFEVLQIFNEPTAVAAAMGMSRQGERRFLVFDFGGATLDVAVMETREVEEKQTLTVLSSFSDAFLGGDDFDRAIADILMQKLETEFPGEYDEGFPVGDWPAARRKRDHNTLAVRRLAKRLKEDFFSKGQNGRCWLMDLSLARGGDEAVDISYAEFLEATAPLFDRCVDCLVTALARANVPLDTVAQVVMVGGSSKLLEVQQRLKRLFPRDVVQWTQSPELTIAEGAAMFASTLHRCARPVMLLADDEVQSVSKAEVQTSKRRDCDLRPRVFGEPISPKDLRELVEMKKAALAPTE